MNNFKINHAAVWVIVVLGQVIPAAWYGAFAEPWMEFNKLTMEDATSAGNAPYVVSIISSISFGYMLAWVFGRMGVAGFVDGLKTGIIMGFPIAILNTMTTNLFSIRPYGLAWIDGGVNLVIWVVAAILLAVWQKK